MSILLIKRTSVTISAKFDAWNPGQSPAHLLTYSIEGHLRLTFDYEFVMHMAADKAMCAYDTLDLPKKASEFPEKSKGISLKKAGHIESPLHYIYPLSKHDQR